MDNAHKYSLFISSTYEDLVDERQSVLTVALENDFIPVGMEQFGAHPADKWDIITRMIDDCDAYLLIIAGRYGSMDDSGVSWTEKEYDYAKEKGIPVIALIRKRESILGDKLDSDQTKLDAFRERVKDGSFNSGFFSNEGELKYEAGRGLHNMKDHLRDSKGGWVRYSDVKRMIDNDRKQYTEENAAVINAMTRAVTAMSEKVTALEESVTWNKFKPISDMEVQGHFK